MKPPWSLKSVPEWCGRNAIVTGANTGIGYQVAQALANKGANVTLACRDRSKARAARNQIEADQPLGSAATAQLDLADLRSVADFAAKFISSHSALDLLILNAGVMAPPPAKTQDGFEQQIGVNHLGHFALTGRLLHLLEQTEAARVVVVSSVMARVGKLQLADLHFARRYRRLHAYAQSKLANQLFTRELRRRLLRDGSHIQVTSAHPGWSKTDLQRHVRFARWLNPILGMAPERGALPILRAATDPDAENGSYYGPDGLLQLRGGPTEIPMAHAAHRTQDAQRLWRLSEELTGVIYPALAETACS